MYHASRMLPTRLNHQYPSCARCCLQFQHCKLENDFSVLLTRKLPMVWCVSWSGSFRWNLNLLRVEFLTVRLRGRWQVEWMTFASSSSFSTKSVAPFLHGSLERGVFRCAELSIGKVRNWELNFLRFVNGRIGWLLRVGICCFVTYAVGFVFDWEFDVEKNLKRFPEM